MKKMSTAYNFASKNVLESTGIFYHKKNFSAHFVDSENADVIIDICRPDILYMFMFSIELFYFCYKMLQCKTNQTRQKSKIFVVILECNTFLLQRYFLIHVG